jgi:hypothetical protein
MEKAPKGPFDGQGPHAVPLPPTTTHLLCLAQRRIHYFSDILGSIVVYPDSQKSLLKPHGGPLKTGGAGHVNTETVLTK